MIALEDVFEPRPLWPRIRTGMLLFFGVVLPLTALIVELATGMNSSAFFDPVPTLGHAVLIAWVAIANAWAWFVVTRKHERHLRWAARALGVAIGVAGLYAALFLPLLPLGAIGIVVFGLGLLVWAPLASFIVALRLRRRLSRAASDHGIPVRVWPGIVFGLVALIVLDLPGAITQFGVRLALDGEAASRARGIHLLRSLGSEDMLLRMCYVRTGRATDLLGFILNASDPVFPERVRPLYYRVTGQAFDAVPQPRALGARRGPVAEWDDFDLEQGSGLVGRRLRDLRLASSRLDGSVSADAALGYLEWTMVFQNDSHVPREARARIALPPGAVVSRVTLWINGEEREAAFAGRGEVTAAYRAVVSQRRDPVLVTTAGPDRISMQLFPVPSSGEMKVRIGMTVPMALRDAREEALLLPYFHERNFQIRDDLRHQVWIESPSTLHSTLTALASSSYEAGMFRAAIQDEQLDQRDAAILATRGGQNTAWAEDMRVSGYVVRQTMGQNEAFFRPRQLVLVMDGSASMRDAARDVARQVAALPDDVDIRLVFAQDEGVPSVEGRVLSGAVAANEIGSFDYDGGHDNAAALVRALDIASGWPDAVVVWIHGPQPVQLDSVDLLNQRVTRGAKPARWYELQVSPGRNVVTEELDGIVSISTLRSGDLERLVAGWRSGERGFTVRRERIEATANALPASDKTSDHLVRLWAKDEVTQLIRAGHRAQAIGLAHQYQLVTPVSGAVVLETQQQYDAAGLQPVPEGTVPTIPEPEEWALIIVALLVLAYAYKRRFAFERRVSSAL